MTNARSTVLTGWAYGVVMPEVRQQVRDAVAARRPVDARERTSIAEFVRVLDELAEPFDEHADRRHVTSSAIVTSDDGRRVLLHRHKRLGMWLQPGGHIDPGELPWDAALREAGEEGGVPVTLASPDLVHVDVHPGPRGHTHLDLRYVVTAPRVTPSPAAGESQEVQWFAWHQAIDLAEPGLEGVLRALQPGDAVVRKARHSDASGCASVFLRSRAFALAEVPLVHSESDVRRWMGDELVGRTDMWVAEVDGVVAGLLVLERGSGDDAGWIDHLYLDPSWIGRGLGDRFVTVAKERHPTGLQLWTFQVNTPARRFYERHGFVPAELTDGGGNEERAPDVRYVWTP